MRPNQIQGDYVGSKLTLYVNEQLAEADDAEFDSGDHSLCEVVILHL
jgi:hypothetical protein